MSALPKIGLDIGSASIKLAELAPVGKKWKLLTMASIPSPANWMSNQKANSALIVSDIIKLCKEAGVHGRRVVIALPEEQVSSHIIELPTMDDSEVEQALQWQVEQYIPMPLDQAVWSYQIVRRDAVGSEGIEVLIAAVAKSMVEFYRSVAESAGLEVLALETELMSTARSVLPANPQLAMIVDIGSNSTDIGLVQNGNLLFTRAIPTASMAFNRAIETGLGLESAQAEEYKNTYGFSNNHLEGKLMEAMSPVLNMIIEELKKTIDFYSSKHHGETIKFITLSGGAAAIPEIVGQISAKLGLEVNMADPFANILMDASQKSAIGTTGPFYSVALGLSMREI